MLYKNIFVLNNLYLIYRQIWLHLPMDDHYKYGYVTKFTKKNIGGLIFLNTHYHVYENVASLMTRIVWAYKKNPFTMFSIMNR